MGPAPRNPAAGQLGQLGPRLALAAADPDALAAAARARSALDAVAWDRVVRSNAKVVAARSAWTGALANAAFEGAELPAAAAAEVAAGLTPKTPMGQVITAATDLAGQAPRYAELLGSAPLQVLAEAATLVGRGVVPTAELGRPRLGAADDPLHLPDLPVASQVAPALSELGQILARSDAPAVLVAALVHAHLALLRPFPWGSGLIARAAIRWTLAGRSVDPDMLTVPEAGLARMGRARYVRSLMGYQDGSVAGVGSWVSAFCAALSAGARVAADRD